MKKQGIIVFAVVGNSQIKMDKVFHVTYKDLTLIGKMINIADFKKELKSALKNPKTMEVVLTEHQGILDRLMEKTTVIPFQFGTILKDEGAAADHLKSSYTTYKELLKKFKDRQEWGVRVFAAQTNQDNTQKPSSGTAYLLRKKQEEEMEKATNEKLAIFSGEILNNLKEFAFEYKVTQSAQRFSEKGELLISVFAFLILKSETRKFKQKFAMLGKKYQDFGLRLISSGPWPASNFVS